MLLQFGGKIPDSEEIPNLEAKIISCYNISSLLEVTQTRLLSGSGVGRILTENFRQRMGG